MSGTLSELIEHIENYGFCVIYCDKPVYNFLEVYNNLHSFYRMIGLNTEYETFRYKLDRSRSLRIIVKMDFNQFISSKEYGAHLQKVNKHSFIFLLSLII